MDKHDLGLQVRTKVMGQGFVQRAQAKTNSFNAPLQEWINEHAWGSTWCRDGIDLKTRSLVTIGMLTALKATEELKGHLIGAKNNGCSIEEIREVLLHSAVYCGAPACQAAFRVAVEVFQDDI